MTIPRSLPLALCLALCLALTAPAAAVFAAEPAVMDAERTARWELVAEHIFGNRRIEPTDTLIELDAPKRAEDAALVPVTLTMPQKDRIKSVYLVIDENPGPLAAHVTFGPAADPSVLQVRVRVDTYTNVHAVAETGDGRLHATAAFVKASGGCSAPAGATDAEAMRGMGEMRMRFADGAIPGKPVRATLMIRHPNFNGMQMNQVTRTYTPPRYIDKVSIFHGDAKILDLAADISLSTNPVITFAFVPQGKGPVRVVVSDTGNDRWERSFDIPAATN